MVHDVGTRTTLSDKQQNLMRSNSSGILIDNWKRSHDRLPSALSLFSPRLATRLSAPPSVRPLRPRSRSPKPLRRPVSLCRIVDLSDGPARSRVNTQSYTPEMTPQTRPADPATCVAELRFKLVSWNKVELDRKGRQGPGPS